MFITPVPESESTDDLADYYRKQRTAWGFLPNYAGAFSTRPDVAQAWNLLNSTIRDGMDWRRFELATIAAARALRSTYCTAAHSKILRDVCGDEGSLRAIAADPSGAGLEAQDRAVYEFAAKVATDAGVHREVLVGLECQQGPLDVLERAVEVTPHDGHHFGPLVGGHRDAGATRRDAAVGKFYLDLP